jgi:hypothetical protein
MTLFLCSFAAIALAGLGMAVGVLAGRRPLCSGCAELRLLGPEAGACGGCARKAGRPGMSGRDPGRGTGDAR